MINRDKKTAGIWILVLGAWLAPSQASANLVTPWESIPDFCASPSRSSVRSGNWSDPGTWGGTLPQPNEIVVINAGHTVTFDAPSTPSIGCVGIKGTLTFRTDINTSLKSATILVYDVGHLLVGTAGAPISNSVKAEMIIADQPLNLGTDPDQFGTGLISLGEVKMMGAQKLPTFLRVDPNHEPKINDSVLVLSQAPQGWKVGDLLDIPDSRHLKPLYGEMADGYVIQSETVIITGISGNQVTISPALKFNHLGARDMNGHLDFAPYVGNLTRNVVIRSENPDGNRGHTLFTHRADVDVEYVQFQDLGRTTNEDVNPVSNHMGRYAMHVHHLYGPNNQGSTSGYQFKLIGNAVFNTTNVLHTSTGAPAPTKWLLSVHNSSYGLIQDNVGFNATGSGFVTEDGSESYNVFEHNFVAGIYSPNAVSPRDQNGRDGSDFWFMGFNHIVRKNVASVAINNSHEIVTGSGYNFSRCLRDLVTDPNGHVCGAGVGAYVNVPLYRGADTSGKTGSLQGREYEVKDLANMTIPEFSDNEAYGAMATGLTVWMLGGAGNGDLGIDPGETLIKNFVTWHIWEEGFYNYVSKHLTFDGFTVRGHPSTPQEELSPYAGFNLGWQAGDYFAENVIIRNANIQGMQGGISMSGDTEGTVTIQDSYLRNLVVNIDVPTFFTPGTKINPVGRQLTIQNVKFDPVPNYNPINISMNYHPLSGNTGHPNLIQKNEVYVTSYNGNSGDNFRLYFNQQLPSALMEPSDPVDYDPLAPPFLPPPSPPGTSNPKASYSIAGCSDSSQMTNLQCWDAHHMATAGVDPRSICTTPTTRSGINGLICGGNAPPPPPNSPCDVSGDGFTNVSDVQIEVNYAIGAVTCDARGDINHDSACNVVDVQRVVNAALGGQCVSP